jgi:hypothetical protein
VPNFASLIATLVLVYCLSLFEGGTKLFRDSDSGWHIRTGERILETRTVPHSDPYSFSRPGATWHAWEWAADLLMGLAHRWDGLRGVALLYATAIFAVSWVWVELNWAVGTPFLLVGAAAPLLVTTSSLHWLARPHVFSWLLLLGTIAWAERGVRRPWLALAIGAVWANVHGSFFLGPLVLGAYAVGGAARRERWGRFAAAGLFAAGGTLLNPDGAGLHAHVVEFLLNRDLLQRIAEFQTFNFQLEGAFQIQLTLVAGITGAVLCVLHRRWEHALLLGLLCWIGLRSARGLPLLAMAGLPLAAAAIGRELKGWPGFLEYCGNLRAIDRKLKGWPMVPVAVLLAIGLLRAGSVGFPPAEFPVEAAAKIPAGARLFAPDKFGGYLIYQSVGTRPVFFDGRSDFYGLEFMKSYIRMVEVRPGWQALFDSWDFTHALVARDAPLRAALLARGWKEVSADRASVLLERT